MDVVNKPGTTEEKYNNMKEQMKKKGRWNEEAEKELKKHLGIVEAETVAQQEPSEEQKAEQPKEEVIKPKQKGGKRGRSNKTNRGAAKISG